MNFDVLTCAASTVVGGPAVVAGAVVAVVPGGAVVAGGAAVVGSGVVVAVLGEADAAGPTAVGRVVADSLDDDPPHDAARRIRAKPGRNRRIGARYTRHSVVRIREIQVLRVAQSSAIRTGNLQTADGSHGRTGQNLPVITFNGDLRGRLQANLSNHQRRVHPLEGRRAAAVAIVIVDSALEVMEDPYDVGDDPNSIVPGDSDGFDDRMSGVSGGAAFLLCRRAARLSSHSRQWALPGGRIDAGETAVEAAHREVAEEVGLDLGVGALLGVLDDFPTRSGYVITPVVFWADASDALSDNSSEVAQTYRVALTELLRADSPRYVDIPESDRPVVQIPLGRALIHAPTGAVLLQFRWVALDGRANERVDHLEQPVFAWK